MVAKECGMVSEDPFEFATGAVRFGDGPTIPVSSFSMATDPPAPAYKFEAGSLEAYGTITATLSGEAAAALDALLRPSWPPRYDCRYAYPEGDEQPCPVCHEPATGFVVEGVAIIGDGRTENPDGSIGYRLAGVDPEAYRCEPCGHRFDKDGKEIVD
jgi:hypothetical protein